MSSGIPSIRTIVPEQPIGPAVSPQDIVGRTEAVIVTISSDLILSYIF